jgi:hypothetical protein
MTTHRLITLEAYLKTGQANLEKGLEQDAQLLARFEQLSILYHEGGDAIVVPREGPPIWIAALAGGCISRWLASSGRTAEMHSHRCDAP